MLLQISILGIFENNALFDRPEVLEDEIRPSMIRDIKTLVDPPL